MGLKLSNRATSTLATALTDSATSLPITADDEGRFPRLGIGDWFPLTVTDEAGNRENMRCVERDGVTLTVIRAQEGTTARNFEAGARVDIRLTAGAFHEHTRDASQLTDGEVADQVLPPRLQEVIPPIANADLLDATGHYVTDVTTTGLPAATVGFLFHREDGSGAAYQEWQALNAQDRWARIRDGSSWAAWYRPYIAFNQANVLVPVGPEAFYGGDTAPEGWLLCSGQAISPLDLCGAVCRRRHQIRSRQWHDHLQPAGLARSGRCRT